MMVIDIMGCPGPIGSSTLYKRNEIGSDERWERSNLICEVFQKGLLKNWHKGVIVIKVIF